MAHKHDRSSRHYGVAFGVGVALNVAYVAIEAGYGFYAGSLALLSDAGHNLSDVFGLLLAWGGLQLARIPPSNRRTYGWRGSTILAALFNALLLLGAVGGIAWEAVRRFSEPAELVGLPIMVVASIGVVINTATALLFLRGQHDDLNIRGAFLHMATDAAVSVGVVLAGLGIYATGWNWIDPATSLVIVVVIFVGTWGLLKDSVNLAMQAVPGEIDPVAVREYLEQIGGVTEVHDLHIWAMSTTEKALTVHLVKPRIENEDALLHDLQHELEHRFQVDHITVQIERGSRTDCHQADPENV